MIKNIVNSSGEVIGQLELPDDTTEEVWQKKLSAYLTPTRHLDEEIARILAMFDTETTAFIKNKYSIERQVSLSLIRNDARFENKMNRFAYVSGAVDWVNQVLAYHFGKNAEIEAAQTLEDLYNISWDLDALNALDPDVSIETAMGIND